MNNEEINRMKADKNVHQLGVMAVMKKMNIVLVIIMVINIAVIVWR